MRIYNWYKIFNIDEFLATNLGSKIYNVSLQGVGDAVFTVFLGNVVSVMYLDEFMPLDMYTPPLYEKDQYALYRDDENGDIYFGFLVIEDEN